MTGAASESLKWFEAAFVAYADERDGPDALMLETMLRVMRAPEDEIFISPNPMAATRVLPMGAPRIRRARDLMLKKGRLVQTHKGGSGPGDADRFRFQESVAVGKKLGDPIYSDTERNPIYRASDGNPSL